MVCSEREGRDFRSLLCSLHVQTVSLPPPPNFMQTFPLPSPTIFSPDETSVSSPTAAMVLSSVLLATAFSDT